MNNTDNDIRTLKLEIARLRGLIRGAKAGYTVGYGAIVREYRAQRELLAMLEGPR